MLHWNQLPVTMDLKHLLEAAASEVLAAIITTSVAVSLQHKAKEACSKAAARTRLTHMNATGNLCRHLKASAIRIRVMHLAAIKDSATAGG